MQCLEVDGRQFVEFQFVAAAIAQVNGFLQVFHCLVMVATHCHEHGGIIEVLATRLVDGGDLLEPAQGIVVSSQLAQADALQVIHVVAEPRHGVVVVHGQAQVVHALERQGAGQQRLGIAGIVGHGGVEVTQCVLVLALCRQQSGFGEEHGHILGCEGRAAVQDLHGVVKVAALASVILGKCLRHVIFGL